MDLGPDRIKEVDPCAARGGLWESTHPRCSNLQVARACLLSWGFALPQVLPCFSNKPKTRPSTSKKIRTHFIMVLALLWWYRTGPKYVPGMPVPTPRGASFPTASSCGSLRDGLSFLAEALCFPEGPRQRPSCAFWPVQDLSVQAPSALGWLRLV